jgi:hypothetical protein
MFLNCSTCFGRHTAHHQELKNCNCSHRIGNRQRKSYVKPEAAITVFELLVMGNVSPETCWAIKKHWNNKFYYTAASCWFFLWILCYDARIHEHQVSLVIWFFLYVSIMKEFNFGCSQRNLDFRYWLVHVSLVVIIVLLEYSYLPVVINPPLLYAHLSQWDSPD